MKFCPVCGYDDHVYPPYDEDINPSYDICSCCGFQFGVDDDVEIEDGVFMEKKDTHTQFRNNWIDNGAIVFSESYPKKFQKEGKVAGEDLFKQLENINVKL